jgi:hypothetical protein
MHALEEVWRKEEGTIVYLPALCVMRRDAQTDRDPDLEATSFRQKNYARRLHGVVLV